MQRKTLYTFLAGLAALAIFASAAAAATTTVVTGDTSAGVNEHGWLFNRDTATSTPFEFNFEEQSIGNGSLEVLPIGTTAADKFIGELFLLSDLHDLTVSVDYNLGPASNANQVYVNVYATDPTSDDTKFYDCRFDFVASTNGGANTADFWQTLAFDQTTVATTSVTRGGASGRDTTTWGQCPATMGAMPSGSGVRAISVNFGDTSANDSGMSVHFDNVVINETTTYDFEVPLLVKDACKNGGYVNYGFDNQGECVSSLQANENADK